MQYDNDHLLRDKYSPLVLCPHYLKIIAVGFEDAFPLWALSTRAAGGLKWSTVRIGQVGGSQSYASDYSSGGCEKKWREVT